MHRLARFAALGLALAAAPAAAQTVADDARWEDLQALFFAGRTIAPAGPLLTLTAPTRAPDAALVPISVAVDSTAAGGVAIAAIHLFVDNNPAPLVGVFHFGPGQPALGLSTRVRVDQYTYIHAVAELSDGSLRATQAYVKASGGCSAPAIGDPAAALARLGQMRLNLPATVTAGEPVTAQLLVSHPNATGMQFDQISRNYIPAHFITAIRLTFNGEPVLTVDSDISLSQDPSIHFSFVPDAEGELTAEVTDSRDAVFTQSWPIAATPAM